MDRAAALRARAARGDPPPGGRRAASGRGPRAGVLQRSARDPRGPARSPLRGGVRPALPAPRLPRPLVGRARALRVPLSPRSLRRAHRPGALWPAAAGSHGRASGGVVDLRAFKQARHRPPLVAAFLYFHPSFFAWSLLGPPRNFIAA